MSDYRRLLELTPQVPLPDFDDLVALQARRARRTRVAVAAAAATATAVAIVGALSVSGTMDRSEPLPVDRTPEPTPTFVVPAGQRTLVARIRPADIHGFDVLATVTNSQPEHRGATYLDASATVHTDGINVTYFCRGDSALWLVSQRNGGYGFTRCSPDADTSFRPVEEIDQSTPRHLPQTLSARAYVARPSADWLAGYDACDRKGESDCIALWGVPQPIADPPAEFGFRIYEHRSQRKVLQLWPDARHRDGPAFEALSTNHGDAWVVDRAEVAAPRSDRLAFVLPESRGRRLLSVFTHRSAHYWTCVAHHEDVLPDWDLARAEHDREADRLCGNDVRLLVDGTHTPAPASDDFGTEWGDQPTYVDRGEHQVVVTITRGDLRNVEFAVLIREEVKP